MKRLFCAALASGLSCSGFAASFLPIGGAGVYVSDAYGVSADGGVVVGNANTGGGNVQAFRWTPLGGIEFLGDLPGGPVNGQARGLSADGSVVVGTGVTAAGFQAFRWTAATGMVGLGTISGSTSSQGMAVSASGDVVVGSGGFEASRWTSSTGMVGLGQLPGGVEGQANAISADGTMIAGESGSGLGRYPFLWTVATGLVSLGAVPGQCPNSFANGISADGSTVVGRIYCANTEAYVWRAGTGMVAIGDLPGGLFSSEARAASGDGSVVVGTGLTNSGSEAFIWTAGDGMRRLLDVLVERGATGLDGWILQDARAISADGQWIAGRAYGQIPGEDQATSHAFLANMAPVPVPAGLWLFASALGVLGWLRRRT